MWSLSTMNILLLTSIQTIVIQINILILGWDKTIKATLINRKLGNILIFMKTFGVPITKLLDSITLYWLSLRSTIQVIKQSLNALKEKQELQELIVSST